MNVQQTAIFQRCLDNLIDLNGEDLKHNINIIINDPQSGVFKKGDLAAVQCLAFSSNDKMYSLSYQQQQDMLILTFLTIINTP